MDPDKRCERWVNIHYSLLRLAPMLLQCFLAQFAELIVVPTAAAVTVKQPPGTATRCRLYRCLNKAVSWASFAFRHLLTHRHVTMHIAGTWNSGAVSALLCRVCKTVFPRKAAPANSVAVGYTSLTPHNVHACISTGVLNGCVNRAMDGWSHQSDAELSKTIGHGQFAALEGSSDRDCVPLQSFRELNRIYRALSAFPDATLRGLFFHCVVCGHTHSRIHADGCRKCNRFAGVGGAGTNEVYALPCSVLLPATRTAPAVSALRLSESSRPIGSCGDARMQAGAERGARNPLDQHGAYAMSCSHLSALAVIEMNCPESISGHVCLAVLIAFAMGCLFFYGDTMCIFQRHIEAQRGGRSLGSPLRALCGAADTTSERVSPDVDAAVSADDFSHGGNAAVDAVRSAIDASILSAAKAPASFTVQCTLEEGAAAAAASAAASAIGVVSDPPTALPRAPEQQPRVPKQPSDYDMYHYVYRLLLRALGQDAMIKAAIPDFHAFVHACRRYLSRVPGSGVGSELSEWLNAQVLSRLGPASRTMTAEDWRLFVNTNLALHNHRKSLDVAFSLLGLFVRATIALEQRTIELDRQRGDYAKRNPDLPVSDPHLRNYSIQGRRVASQSSNQSRSSSDAAMNHFVRTHRLALVVRTLTSIRDDVFASVGIADRDAAAVYLVDEAGFDLPSVLSYNDLEQKISSYRDALDKLSGSISCPPLDSDNVIAKHLRSLHALATELAHDNWKIELHRVTQGGKNTTSESLYAHRGTTLKKLSHCLACLKRLVPHSPQKAVREWVLPDIGSISGPGDLPSSVGNICVTPGDLALDHLIEAYEKRERAKEELQFLKGDIFDRVAFNIDAVISQLSTMLQALCADDPDLGVGAGPSGLWGGMPDALFDFAALPQAKSGESLKQLAAGMACKVAEGLRVWRQQREQIGRLQTGLKLLLETAGASVVVLNKDSMRRAVAMRHGRALLSGRMSPVAWAHVALHGRSEQRAPRLRPSLVFSSALSALSDVASVDAQDDNASGSSWEGLDGGGEDEDAGDEDSQYLVDNEEEDAQPSNIEVVIQHARDALDEAAVGSKRRADNAEDHVARLRSGAGATAVAARTPTDGADREGGDDACDGADGSRADGDSLGGSDVLRVLAQAASQQHYSAS